MNNLRKRKTSLGSTKPARGSSMITRAAINIKSAKLASHFSYLQAFKQKQEQKADSSHILLTDFSNSLIRKGQFSLHPDPRVIIDQFSQSTRNRPNFEPNFKAPHRSSFLYNIERTKSKGSTGRGCKSEKENVGSTGVVRLKP